MVLEDQKENRANIFTISTYFSLPVSWLKQDYFFFKKYVGKKEISDHKWYVASIKLSMRPWKWQFARLLYRWP